MEGSLRSCVTAEWIDVLHEQGPLVKESCHSKEGAPSPPVAGSKGQSNQALSSWQKPNLAF
eukprot:12489724-Prorocentrum_lima.AAC.1